MHLNRLLIGIALCATFVWAHAYSHKKIDVKAGLSNNLVLCLAMDNEGYVWAGTEAGLNRIGAGVCTELHRPKGWQHGPRGNHDKVMSLCYDKASGLLFVGTESGLDVVKSKTGAYTTTKGDSLLNYSVQDVAPDHHGGVWLFYDNGQIQHVDCDGLKVSTLPLNLGKGNRSGLDDGKGHLYIGHGKSGMSIIDSRTGQTLGQYVHEPGNETSIPGNNVRRIYQDSYQRIWVGTDHGLALFNTNKGTFQPIRNRSNSFDDNVFDIKEISNGQLWVACDVGGISTVDLPQMACSELQPTTLSSLNARCLLQDNYGNIWVGHHSTGIDFLSDREPMLRQLPYRNAQGKFQTVNAITNDNQGRLWVNGEDELSLWQGDTQLGSWRITGLHNRAHSYARSMMVDRTGHVWMGMEDEGVIRFNPQTQRFEHIDIGYDATDIHSFFEDADGSIWIGSEFGVCVNRNGQISHEEHIDSLIHKAPVTSFIRLGASLIITTQGYGVLIYNQVTADCRLLHIADGLPSENVNQAIADENGGVWIATNRGIAFLPDIKRRDMVCYDSRQGLANNQVQAIALDQHGRLWASTFTHISYLDNERERQFHNFNDLDQQPIGSFVTGSVAHLAGGDIAFGSSYGVCHVKSEMHMGAYDAARPKIAVCNIYQPTTEGVQIIGLLPDQTGRINLSHQQNTLQIVATVDNYAQLGFVDMQYQMKGLQNKWYDMHDDMQVAFHSLPPGKYTFILKAKLKSQDWNDGQQTQLIISIAPPFWRSWWAWLLYLLLATWAIWKAFRAYKHRLELQNSLELSRRESLQKQALNEERLRFFTNITHELRTPLTLILGPLEDLAADRSLAADSRRKVEIIGKSAERLRNLINQILEFRKTETQNRQLTVARGNIGQFVREIVTNYKELNRNPKVDIRYHQANSLPLVYFDSEVITTILNNLLSNAVKYTEQGSIDVTTEMTDDQHILLHVADTGYGIAADALPHIFDRYYQTQGSHQASGTGIGLSLVKSLSDLHEAQISVQSTEGKGCMFTLELSVANTYPTALHKEDGEEEEERAEASDPAPQARGREGSLTEEEPEAQLPLLLVVEDNDDIRQYIADSLGEEFRILQACNGMEGAALATQHIPDLIISDIMMPKMNGIQLTHQLKESLPTSHIPIILLTAKDSDTDKEEGYENGADSYLIKPFTAKLLSTRIRNLLANRRRLAEQLTSKGVESIANSPSAPLHMLSRLDRGFLERLDQIIEENILQTDIDMPFLTDKMAMSHSTFYRKVKALTGLTAKEYVRKQRLRYCYQLLESGDYNVNEAAAMTGFNQLSHFRETFRKEFGITPSDVIRQHKQPHGVKNRKAGS